MELRSLVLGLGNDLLCDDGVGLVVAREARKLLPPTIDVVESGEAGLALLEFLADYDKAVIVDAIQLGAPPGTVHLLSRDAFGRVVAPSAHYAGLAEVFSLGTQIGVKLPSHLSVVAIEAEDPYLFSEALTPEVQRAVPKAVDAVLHALGYSTSTSIR